MKSIWVVDDDHAIRFVLEKALTREGLPVRSFSNTRDVRSALEAEGPPQVLISDIRMPGGSGLELLASVKAEHPRLPVIVMTAFSDLDSAVQAFQGGAFDYLAKPFDLQRALTPHEALSALYGQRRAQFDATVMTTFVRCVGIYPPGTVVTLSNGTLGLVVSVNSSRCGSSHRPMPTRNCETTPSRRSTICQAKALTTTPTDRGRTIATSMAICTAVPARARAKAAG